MRVAVNTPGATQDQVGEAEASVMTTTPVGLKSLPLNCQLLVEEQQKDPSLAYALKMATCVREERDVPTGYFVRDNILIRAIEQFQSTLESIIRTFVEAKPREWDEAISFLLSLLF